MKGSHRVFWVLGFIGISACTTQPVQRYPNYSSAPNPVPVVQPVVTPSPAVTNPTQVYPNPPQGLRWGWQDAVLFPFNKAHLEKRFHPTLQGLVDTLQRYPDINILITGHADNTGDAAYNRRLSERRMKTVSDFLQRKGIPSHRIVTRAFGEQRPTGSNACPEDRQRNRRVDLAFFPAGYSPDLSNAVTGESLPIAGTCEEQRRLFEQLR
ncbi:OmpA family protein [Thioflexithrix psekupsensis]|uniref:OmpA-like domain-containing protein n=1 Tax=Thioflexithrix psekupsensis TaxID=1570016 RepID=A0A251X6G1_9GAMM|nr:OmpA family protein [Thioflexithrix psekupsensis]OUD13335.1 hypothetical protein TPSD3_11990 [Thioflexithrix psekupsensis]